jgi:spoIIIJ-associated protein
MQHEVTKTGETVEEAVDAGLEELGVQADAAEYEVLEHPGADRAATVRVWLTEAYLAEQVAEDEEPEDEESEEVLPVELRVEEHEPLTEEQLDEIADAAVAAIQEVLGTFGIEAAIDEYEGDEGEIILDIVGGELGILIGRHGKTLDAMQVLVGAISSRKAGRRHPVIVDVEGYRGRRREKLEDIARRTADRVSRQGHAVGLRPMTSYERRVIHMALRDDKRVTTGSEGEEPNRQVVVSPR